jgi:precorrin-4/cobalt-precorrin-4 C11-methyltransferase
MREGAPDTSSGAARARGGRSSTSRALRRSPSELHGARRPGNGGLVSFVGAGPGAPDLLTLRGARRLAEAELVVWASSLVPEVILEHASPNATILDSSTMTLEEVLEVFAANPHARIVRLHSGDPSLYGAIQEQIDWCLVNRRAFEVVPGVSSLGAAAAALGRELTVPGVAQSVILTRLPGRTASSMGPRESLGQLAATGSTMAVFLSAARPETLQAALLAPPSAYRPETPAAVVVAASRPEELVVPTTVGELAAAMRATGATTTALVLVGDALEASGRRSKLYDPAFAHAHRRRSLPGSTAGRPARA